MSVFRNMMAALDQKFCSSIILNGKGRKQTDRKVIDHLPICNELTPILLFSNFCNAFMYYMYMVF